MADVALEDSVASSSSILRDLCLLCARRGAGCDPQEQRREHQRKVKNLHIMLELINHIARAAIVVLADVIIRPSARRSEGAVGGCSRSCGRKVQNLKGRSGCFHHSPR